jgi:hypothetical protein
MILACFCLFLLEGKSRESKRSVRDGQMGREEEKI